MALLMLNRTLDKKKWISEASWGTYTWEKAFFERNL